MSLSSRRLSASLTLHRSAQVMGSNGLLPPSRYAVPAEDKIFRTNQVQREFAGIHKILAKKGRKRLPSNAPLPGSKRRRR